MANSSTIAYNFAMIKKIEKEALKFFENPKGSHDWDHTLRVYKLAEHIGKKEKANLEIIRAAALLHDIARHKEDLLKGKIDHAVAGAEIAGTILKRLKYPASKIQKIQHAIECHRFRNNKIPQTLEARVLFDADKLDSIGAVGIGRAFLFAGEIGAKLHNKNVDISKTKPYTVEDTAYREFMVKLRKIASRMLTREGKRIAKSRHKFMLEFFKRLDKESEGLI